MNEFFLLGYRNYANYSSVTLIKRLLLTSTVMNVIETENVKLNFVSHDFSHKQIGSQETHRSCVSCIRYIYIYIVERS